MYREDEPSQELLAKLDEFLQIYRFFEVFLQRADDDTVYDPNSVLNLGSPGYQPMREVCDTICQRICSDQLLDNLEQILGPIPKVHKPGRRATKTQSPDFDLRQNEWPKLGK